MCKIRWLKAFTALNRRFGVYMKLKSKLTYLCITVRHRVFKPIFYWARKNGSWGWSRICCNSFRCTTVHYKYWFKLNYDLCFKDIAIWTAWHWWYQINTLVQGLKWESLLTYNTSTFDVMTSDEENLDGRRKFQDRRHIMLTKFGWTGSKWKQYDMGNRTLCSSLESRGDKEIWRTILCTHPTLTWSTEIWSKLWSKERWQNFIWSNVVKNENSFVQ